MNVLLSGTLLHISIDSYSFLKEKKLFKWVLFLYKCDLNETYNQSLTGLYSINFSVILQGLYSAYKNEAIYMII